MDSGRRQPFKLALTALRERLRQGDFATGERIAASDLADELRLSATPVREALSRLAGEGLLEERRGQGFFLPAWAAADVADLYRLSLAHLEIALDPRRSAPWRASARASDLPAVETDPVGAVEHLFELWVAEVGGRRLAVSHRRLQAQLAPVRRLEKQVLEDLDEEATALIRLGEPSLRPGRIPQVARFHERRIAVAEALSALAGRRPAGSQL